jgi:hypothetical protein
VTQYVDDGRMTLYVASHRLAAANAPQRQAPRAGGARMMSQPTTTPQQAVERRGLAVPAILLWLAATGLLAFAPVLYFAAGGSDNATDAKRLTAAAIPVALAWPLLVLAMGLTPSACRDGRTRALTASSIGSALLLLLFASAVFEGARLLAAGPTISGDVGWALYWIAAASAWIVLSRRSARRRH